MARSPSPEDSLLTSSFFKVSFSSDKNQICHLVHRASEDQVFIHVKKLRKKYNFREMEEELNDADANPQPHAEAPRRFQPVLAYNDEKFKFCRGRVSNTKNKDYLIYFVDYGNSELKCEDEIFVLPEKFIKIPVLAYKCVLVRAEMDVKELDQDDDVNCIFISDSEPYKVIFKLPESSCLYYDTVRLEKGEEYEVLVTHVVDIHEFYVRLKKFSKKYDVLQANLQVFAEEAEGVDSSGKMSLTPEIKTCAVYSGKEEKWMRGLVSFSLPLTSSVIYVDVGYMEDMYFINSAKPLSKELVDTLPAQAIRCRLFGIPAVSSFPDGYVKDIFRKIIGKYSTLRIKVVKMEDNIADVILFDEQDKSFSLNDNILIQVGTNIAREIPLPNLQRTETIFVTHFKSFREFYGQLARISLDDLFEFEGLLNKYGTSSPLGPPCVFGYRADRPVGWSAVGQVCCAQYGLDGKFYRGKIVSHSPSEAEVLFVDYGNTEKFSILHVKVLPAELASKPQIGFMCSAVETLRFETEVCHLREAVMNQTLEVKILEEDLQGISKVEFTQALCNKQVLKLLQPQVDGPQAKKSFYLEPSLRFTTIPFDRKEKAVLVHLRNWKHLFFQLPRFKADLDHVTANVQLAAKHGDKFQGVIVRDASCLAKFSYDGVWYRGQVRDLQPGDKYLVEFVDFGNREVVHHSNIRLIPDFLMGTPRLALECRLYNHPKFDIPEDILLDFEGRALNKMFIVEFKKFDSYSEKVYVRFVDELGSTLIQLCSRFAAKLSQRDSNTGSRSHPTWRGPDNDARLRWSPDYSSKSQAHYDSFKNEDRENNKNVRDNNYSRRNREARYESENTGVNVWSRGNDLSEKKVRNRSQSNNLAKDPRFQKQF